MRIRTVHLVGLLCLALAGCTTTSQGEPAPAPTSGSSTANSTPPKGDGDLPNHGAPKVADPLDTTRFQQDPCATLTTAQAQQLGLSTNGQQGEILGGTGCTWSTPNTRGEVQTGFITDNSNGLSAAYAADQDGKYAYFQELPPIEDFPAIAIDAVDRRPEGICLIYVGVTDQLVFNVYLKQSPDNVGKTKPCDVAALVAGKALQTMKEEA